MFLCDWRERKSTVALLGNQSHRPHRRQQHVHRSFGKFRALAELLKRQSFLREFFKQSKLEYGRREQFSGVAAAKYVDDRCGVGLRGWARRWDHGFCSPAKKRI